MTFIIVFVGVLSSIASDAGYLILIPLAAAAFLSVGGTRWRASPPPTPASPRASPSTS